MPGLARASAAPPARTHYAKQARLCGDRMRVGLGQEAAAPAAPLTASPTKVALSAMRAPRKRRSTSGHVAAPSSVSHRRWPLPGEYCARARRLVSSSSDASRQSRACLAASRLLDLKSKRVVRLKRLQHLRHYHVPAGFSADEDSSGMPTTAVPDRGGASDKQQGGPHALHLTIRNTTQTQ